MDGQLIVGRGQTAPCFSVLGLVHHKLGMLDAHAHGKGLWLHGDTHAVQHGKGVPGAVPNGEDQAAAAQTLCARRRGELHAVQAAVFHTNPGESGLKTHFASQRKDSCTQILHHGKQHVRTHMGLGVVQNVFTGARLYKLFKHPACPFIFRPRVELAVRERSGAALPELHIAFRVKGSPIPEFLHLLTPCLSIAATFQHNGAQSRQCQCQRGKHPGRAKANHHRTVRRLGGRPGQAVDIGAERGDIFIPALFQHAVLALLCRHVYGIDVMYIVFFSGVQGAPCHRQSADLRGSDLQLLCRQIQQHVSVVLYGDGNITDSQHVRSLTDRPDARKTRPTADYSRRSRRQCPAPPRRHTGRGRCGFPASWNKTPWCRFLRR